MEEEGMEESKAGGREGEGREEKISYKREAQRHKSQGKGPREGKECCSSSRPCA
jgi:hypothetical protein